MTPNPVVYEVNLTVARHRADEFDQWLGQHVNAMLELAGFVDAKVFDSESGDDGSVVARSVHYELRDQSALDHYLDEHAPRMRADGAERFGDDLSASRRILTPNRDGERCTNCQAPLAGQYCARCGQRHRTRMISLWELLRDVFEDAFSWDSRVWRSLRPLLLRPGRLTSEYLDGRRTYYTPPLRMYLVLSIAFFLLSSLPALEDFNAAKMLRVETAPDDFEVRFGPEDTDDVSPEDLQVRFGSASIDAKSSDAESSEPRDPVEIDASDPSEESSEPDEDFECDFSDAEISIPGIPDALVRERLVRLCLASKTSEGRARFIDNFADLLPKLLIVLLPLLALAGKIIYPFSRRYYVEHLLFYTHFHSFVFLALIITMLIQAASQRVSALAAVSSLFGVAVGLYTIYYLYRALRVVFGQGRLATFYKMFLIFLTYTFGVTIFTLIGVALAALSV